MQLLRSDIVMDVGNPINPAIDIGQVEGAFVQGMGWSVLEELQWGDAQHPWVRPGQLFTRGPGTYKIPSVNDIPVDFRVALLQNAPNPRAVHSSKVRRAHALGRPIGPCSPSRLPFSQRACTLRPFFHLLLLRCGCHVGLHLSCLALP